MDIYGKKKSARDSVWAMDQSIIRSYATIEEMRFLEEKYRQASELLGQDWNEWGIGADTPDDKLAEAAQLMGEYRIKLAEIKHRKFLESNHESHSCVPAR